MTTVPPNDESAPEATVPPLHPLLVPHKEALDRFAVAMCRLIARRWRDIEAAEQREGER